VITKNKAMRLLKKQYTMRGGKQLFGVAFLCLFGSAALHAQVRWNVVKPDSMGYYPYYSSISVFGNSCLFLSQQNLTNEFRSVIWRSDDGGLTWRMQDPGLQPNNGSLTSFPLNSVDLIDSLVAIAVGDSGIVMTYDAGNTWSRRNPGVKSNLIGVHCSSPGQGIIIGMDSSVILVLTDERGWRVVPFVPDSVNDYPVSCHSYGDETFRAFESESGIFTTSDDWQTVDSSFYPSGWRGPNLLDLSYSNASVGNGDTLLLTVDRRGKTILDTFACVRSFDGGNHWEFIEDTFTLFLQSPVNNNTVIALERAPFGNWWGGAFALSTDVGSTWQTDTMEFDTTLGTPAIVNALAFLSDGSMIGVFSRYITSANGGSYDDQFIAKSDPLYSSVEPFAPSAQQTILYPNPAINSLNVENADGTIAISDPLGRSYAVPRNGDALDISSLPSGVYFVSDGHSRAKFVKE
jgi:Secretion system C-terminal sorting domain